jgi:hypothetical protein
MIADAKIAIDYLPEPLLEFGYGQTGADPREGLFLFGPLWMNGSLFLCV